MSRRSRFHIPSINLQRRFNLRPRSAAYLMLGSFFLVGAVYFVVVNVVSNKGRDLQTLEMSNKDLEAENQRLEVEAARLKSLQVIEEGATGQVQVGEPGAQTDNSQITTGTEQKKVVVVPKLVPSKIYVYLPSYSDLAQK